MTNILTNTFASRANSNRKHAGRGRPSPVRLPPQQLGTGKRATDAVTVQNIPVLQFRPTPRRGLNRNEAAGFVGVSQSKFDEMVKDGRMPRPLRIDGRVIWDIHQLHSAFDKLCPDDDHNPWDDLG
jgi:predicted DNA-binding transcriptional regulator AlpA